MDIYELQRRKTTVKPQVTAHLRRSGSLPNGVQLPPRAQGKTAGHPGNGGPAVSLACTHMHNGPRMGTMRKVETVQSGGRTTGYKVRFRHGVSPKSGKPMQTSETFPTKREAE